MARRVVIVNQLSYGFSPDDPQPLLNRPWPVVTARLLDEITGEPPPPDTIHLSTPLRGLTPRIADGGLIGLVGIPAQVFPALASQSYTVLLTLAVSGYITRQETVVIPSRTYQPNEDFQPTDLGDVPLHSQPILITGRVVQLDDSGKPQPVAGAEISVTGIWRTVPPANLETPPEPPSLVSLQPPLYTNYAAGQSRLQTNRLPDIAEHLGIPLQKGRLQNNRLPPDDSDAKILLDDVSVGTQVIRLSNQHNLAVGALLSIDSDSPDNSEYLAITALEESSNPASPTQVTLAYPLGLAHRKGAIVREVKQFTSDALPGDHCVFLDDVTGLTDQVCISGEVNPPTYHRIALFSAISDSAGYYRLPPLSRVAQLELRAEKEAFSAVAKLRPTYSVLENRVDFVLTRSQQP